MKWWSWLALLAVALGYVDGPLLRGGLPLGDDTEIHLYRLVDLDHLLRQGVLYSRWQPDLVYGYGSPLFSFYAPLSAYLAEAGHLIGFSQATGLLLAFAVLPLAAGLATFLFLRRRLADGPALLGSLAYLSSLYFLYNLFVRGSSSDALAMALYPVVLLLLDRLAERPGPFRAAAVALAYAALLLSHDVSGPLLLPLLVLLAIWWSRGNRPLLGWLVGATGLGIGLALFFLGPAALGAGDTRVPEFLATPGMRYDQHFLALGDLFSFHAVAYPGAMLTELPIGLGVIQSLLALAALPGLPRLTRHMQGEVVIFAVTLAVCAGLTLSASDRLWRLLWPLQLIHYPWRLLALGAFAGALLTGYAAQAWLSRSGAVWQTRSVAASALVLLVLGVPYLYPRPGDALPSNPSLAQVTTFQQRSGALGSTSNSEFLPKGLTSFPPGPSFGGADTGASLIQKLDRSSLPAGTVAQPLADGQLAARLLLDSPAAFVAHFFVFRFPGWTATLDGQPTTLGDPGQFQTLTVPVPAGEHVLALSFGETRRQEIFDVLSGLAAFLVVGLIAIEVVTRRRSAVGVPPPTHLGGTSAVGVGWPVLIVALLVIGLKWSVFDRVPTPLVQPFDGQHPPGMAVVDHHRFGSVLELLGYTSLLEPAIAGGTVTYTLYWRTSAPLPANYSSFVHVLRAEGGAVAQEDNVHVADYPTTWWRVGAYARDVHQIKLPANTPVGSYRVEVGLYDRAAGTQLVVDGTTANQLQLPPLVVPGSGVP